MHYKVDYITMVLVGLLVLLILASFNGCASSNVVYKYIEKPIPVKCITNTPKKPKYSEDVWKYLEDTLIYKDQLEVIIKNCSK